MSIPPWVGVTCIPICCDNETRDLDKEKQRGSHTGNPVPFSVAAFVRVRFVSYPWFSCSSVFFCTLRSTKIYYPYRLLWHLPPKACNPPFNCAPFKHLLCSPLFRGRPCPATQPIFQHRKPHMSIHHWAAKCLWPLWHGMPWL